MRDGSIGRPAAAAPDIELVSVASARDVAQASLVLGEQRAWIESVTGLDMADVEPGSPAEYANPLDWYGRPCGRLLLARLWEEPVGVLALRRLPDGVAQLKRLYVRPRARDHGVARRLVQEALRAADRMGAASVYVEPAPGWMPTAVRLFRDLGFTEGARRYLPVLDGAVAMQLPLGAGETEEPGKPMPRPEGADLVTTLRSLVRRRRRGPEPMPRIRWY